jgi:hypothetical protein
MIPEILRDVACKILSIFSSRMDAVVPTWEYNIEDNLLQFTWTKEQKGI